MNWILVVDVDNNNMFCWCKVLLFLEVILGLGKKIFQIESVSRVGQVVVRKRRTTRHKKCTSFQKLLNVIA